MEDFIRVEKLENGFEVECLDPAIQAANEKSKSMAYRDPYKAYAFSTAEEVVKFIGEKLGSMKAKSKDGGYAAAFKEASAKS
jgi:hypothetical protein